MITRLAPWIMLLLVFGTVIEHLASMDWIARYENADGGAAFAAYPPDQPIWAPSPTVTIQDFAVGRTTEPLPREGGTLTVRIDWTTWQADLAVILFILFAAYVPTYFFLLCDGPSRVGDFLAYAGLAYICSSLVAGAIGLFLPNGDPIESLGRGVSISGTLAVAIGAIVVCVKNARTTRWRATAT